MCRLGTRFNYFSLKISLLRVVHHISEEQWGNISWLSIWLLLRGVYSHIVWPLSGCHKEVSSPYNFCLHKSLISFSLLAYFLSHTTRRWCKQKSWVRGKVFGGQKQSLMQKVGGYHKNRKILIPAVFWSSSWKYGKRLWALKVETNEKW